MYHINVQMDGQMVVLGHEASSEEVAMLANGRNAYGADVQTAFSNVNDLPEAPTNTGMMAKTRIGTPSGPRRIDELHAGDVVFDAQGHESRVLNVLTTEAPRDSYILRAPYFGLDQDVVFAPEQKIEITSDIAEYLFGEETVIVPVWALNDGRKVGHYETRSSDRMFQLQLDTPEALSVGRCAVSALYKIGATKGLVLSDQEARCFASEYRTGFQN